MKKSRISIVLLAFLWVLIGCGTKTEKKQDVATLFEDASKEAVCIWDKVPLREDPNEKGKWLTSVSVGEKVVYLDEAAVDSTPSKPVTYYKITLLDGKTGWVRSDFIVLNGKPAVLLSATPYYNRPDLLTKTDKSFGHMDIVGVKSTQGDWLEVVGKRTGGTWIESGWIKESNISYKDIDIAVAKFALAAIEINDEAKKISALEDIVNNPDFQGSVFIESIREMISSMFSSEDVVFEEVVEEEEILE